jgi:hypothetical protein
MAECGTKISPEKKKISWKGVPFPVSAGIVPHN